MKSNQIRKGLYLEYFSLGWMAVEAIVSVIAGLIVGRSFALLAFAGDSVIEMISAYAVWGFLRNLGKGIFEKDRSERTEKLTLGLLILLIPAISLGAVYSYFTGIEPEASVLGIAVSLGAVIIMPILWIQKKKIGKEANILPLTIDAVESATCFFMSISVLAGLLINYFLAISWVDYVATAIILGFVSLEIKESIEEMHER